MSSLPSHLPMFSDMSHLYLSSPQTHYISQPYYAAAPPPPTHLHVVPPPQRTETRKRPKYTRSKTGCLTCRAKKVKCDETKPNCMRCTHGQRECTWPEGVPARKKSSRKDHQQQQQSHSHSPQTPLDSPVIDTRPSTAGSSGLSDTSTPPTRNHTPPRREHPADIGLPPMVSRRHPDTVHATAPLNDDAPRRQQIQPSTSHGYPVHSGSNTHGLSSIPEMNPSYTSHPSYQQYHNQAHYPSNQPISLSRVSPQHEHSSNSSHHGQWTTQPLMTHVDSIEPYYSSSQERGMVGQAAPQVRYQ
ncbi:hypothetical protein C8Q75DRAFT_775728 [Abortiporus biennis]|nr:hypothetical protein C8Q75DRAFT_775728 [Abortiporus biennis]